YRWKDLSTRDSRDGGVRSQGFSYDMDFTPSVSREQIREIAKTLKKSGVTADSQYILDIELISNEVAFKSCLSVIEALKLEGKNIAEFESGLSQREVETKLYYYQPAPTHP